LHTYCVRAFCFGRRVCRLLSVVCLSVPGQISELREIRVKFRSPYSKSGSPSKKMTSDFASEVPVVKYPKNLENPKIAQNGDLYN